MTIFLPGIMIAFEALMIYGLLDNKSLPVWVQALLVFFISVLGLGIIGYIKQIISKGPPKWQQVGPNKWAANWTEKNKKTATKKNKDNEERPGPNSGKNPHILS